VIQSGPRGRRHIKAVAAYALLIILFYSPVIFGVKSLLPSLYQPHGVVEGGTYKEMKRTPVNSFNIDIATPAYYEFPINKLTGDLYKRGELPLWNPYQGAGTPLAAQFSTRVFFPYQILEDISPVWTWDFYLLGRLLFSAFFTYLFLDLLGLTFMAALAGGAFYMLQGTFVWFINLEQLMNVAMMAPVVMWSTELLARARRGFKIALPAIAAFGLSIGFMLLAGQPEVALYVSLLSFLYYIVRAGNAWRDRCFTGFIAKYAFSYLVGLFIAMPLILPFLELVKSGFHIHPIGGEMGIQILQHWESVFVYLTPTLAEFPTDPEMINGVGLLVKLKDSYFRFLPINGVWDILGGYTGIVLIFIILSGVLYAASRPSFRNRSPLYFFAAFGFAIILKNMGLPPFRWIGYIPVFDQVWTLRWAAPAWAFSFAAAGAIAIELLCSRKDEAQEGLDGASFGRLGRYFMRRPHMAPTVAFLSILSFYFVLSFLPVIRMTVDKGFYFNTAMLPFVFPSMFLGSVLTIFLLCVAFLMASMNMMGKARALSGLFALVVLDLWWAVPRGYDERFLFYKLIPFTIGFVAVVFYYWEMKKEAAVAVAVFLAASFGLDAFSPKGFPQREDPFKEAPYVEFLRDNLGEHRVAGGYGLLFPNFSSALGIKDIRYVNSILPGTYQWYRKNYLHVDTIEEGPSSGLWFTGRPERCRARPSEGGEDKVYDFWLRPVEEDVMKRLRNYSLLGLKYLVLPWDPGYGIHESVFSFEPYDMSSIPLVYQKEARVYEVPDVLPRAYVAFDYELADSFEKAQEIATGDGFDLHGKAVLEEEPGIGLGAKGRYTAVIKDYKANSLTVEVTTDADGLLVLTDLHYPGWQAYVNGKKEKVLRVNGLVRGVPVREGGSEVVFKYRPASFMAGTAAFAAAFGFCVFALVTGRKRKTDNTSK